MLKNAKSNFFIKFLFSFLNDKRKLEIIKYNKKAQNILDISLKNFKLFSGCYIVYEKKGNGKEYFIEDNEIKFEGKYLNKKRNGKGKEYKDGHVIFEGEYLNGKRNGYGYEYDDSVGAYRGIDNDTGKIIFSGEYKNNKKWRGIGYDVTSLNETLYIDPNFKQRKIYELSDGKGIFRKYSISSNLLIEGEYINGDLNGKVKEYYDDYGDKILFEGKYFNGKRWDGKEYDINGNVIYELINGKGYVKHYDCYRNDLKLEFEGEYISGEKNGKCKEYYDGKLIFEGEYKDDKKNGKGKCYDHNTGELEFEGEFLYDWKIKGKEYIKGKLEFEGEYYFNNKYDGKGYDENGNILYVLKNGNGKVKYYHSDRSISFDGENLNGKKSGQGKEYYENILYFEGKFLDGKRNGFGKQYFYKSDKLEYEGNYLNGKKHGKGKEYNKKGILIYDGNYLNDERSGKGKQYYTDGLLLYEGEFLNGLKNGKGKEYDSQGNLIYDGEYRQGSKDGKGKEYDIKNNSKYEGKFTEDKRNGEGKYYVNGKLVFKGYYFYGEKFEEFEGNNAFEKKEIPEKKDKDKDKDKGKEKDKKKCLIF